MFYYFIFTNNTSDPMLWLRTERPGSLLKTISARLYFHTCIIQVVASRLSGAHGQLLS